MALNDYVTLGNSGLRVSPLCLGTMTFGKDWGWGSTAEESCDVLKSYMDRGGNFLDTANLYTRGHSEKIIGDFIRKSVKRRDQLVIATKFFGNLYTGDPNGGGASRKSIFQACDNSLRRLQTDYIDLYWLHCWDRFTPIEETMSALNDLVCAGKVRYIGFSDTPAWKATQAQMIARARGWAPIIALQIEYSLIERTVEGELIPMSLEMGMGVTPWSPLKQGVLSGKYKRKDAGTADPERGDWVKAHLTERNFDIVEELVAVAGDLGASPAAVALAWLLRRPGVAAPIIGARTLQQLEDNFKSLAIELSGEHIDRLDKVSRPTLDFPADFVRSAGSFGYGGTSINGERFDAFALAPTEDSERYEELLVKA